jgi:hypothetical protein
MEPSVENLKVERETPAYHHGEFRAPYNEIRYVTKSGRFTQGINIPSADVTERLIIT